MPVPKTLWSTRICFSTFCCFLLIGCVAFSGFLLVLSYGEGWRSRFSGKTSTVSLPSFLRIQEKSAGMKKYVAALPDFLWHLGLHLYNCRPASGNYKPARVKPSHIPKKRWTGKHFVWGPHKNFKGPSKIRRRVYRIFLFINRMS